MTDARSLGPDDLVAAYFTLARVGRDGRARTSWPERIEAAAAAGFAGIGAMPADYALAFDDADADAASIDDHLRDSGICVAEIDGFPVRWDPTADSPARQSVEDTVFAMADRFGTRHVIYPLVPASRVLPDRSFVVDELGRVCDRAAGHDLIVSVEFVPFVEPIGDIAATWELVNEVDRRNCGVNVDFWHHHAGRNDRDALLVVPGDRITGIHLTDGVPDLSEPDPMVRTQRQRRLPGDGVFPVAETLGALRRGGCVVPPTVEVVTLEHWRLPIAEYARLVGAAARRALDAARDAT